MNPNQENNDDKVRGLIESGAELAGAAVGGALGFFAAGPAGAAIAGAGGVAAVRAIRVVGRELANRFLGPREKIRVGAVIAIAADEVRKRMENGESIRADDFFDKDSTGRTKADEIAESVLLKSQREAEEAKIPYMGYMLANISFNPQINTHHAHQVIKTAGALSYRQLCLLRTAATKDTLKLREKITAAKSIFRRLCTQFFTNVWIYTTAH